MLTFVSLPLAAAAVVHRRTTTGATTVVDVAPVGNPP